MRCTTAARRRASESPRASGQRLAHAAGRALCLLVFAGPCVAVAQQAVYRCTQGTSVQYSHAPCPGATVVDATPTQGMDRFTGPSRKGADVRRAEGRQQFDAALRPLTGKTHAEMEAQRRRLPLSPRDQALCRSLDTQLPVLEQRSQTATGPAREAAESTLYQARREFFWLRC